jgi:hypothetical protein
MKFAFGQAHKGTDRIAKPHGQEREKHRKGFQFHFRFLDTFASLLAKPGFSGLACPSRNFSAGMPAAATTLGTDPNSSTHPRWPHAH